MSETTLEYTLSKIGENFRVLFIWSGKNLPGQLQTASWLRFVGVYMRTGATRLP
jgi:hypothetical protein